MAEDGRELYLESADFDKGKANQWVRENVFPHLKGGEYRWPLRSIRVTLLDFFDIEDYGYPELIGWCSAYDFVAFCQLFGTMMDVPRFIPHYMQDIQQALDEQGITDDMLPHQKGTAHNALSDAKHIKLLWEFLHLKAQERS